MKYYELTINTKESPKDPALFGKRAGPTGQADSLLEKVVSYLPNPAVRQQKNPSFLTLEFYAEPEKIQELEKKLKADSLRYLILVKPPTTPPFSKKGRGVKEKPTIARKKVVREKVELKEIEKKLEEILRE